MKNGLWILAFLCISLNLFSQDQPNVNVGFGVHYGFLAPHNYTMRGLQQHHIRGGELEVSSTVKGNKSWHKLFRYPTFGTSLTILNLGNPDKLGTGLAIYPFIKFPLFGGDKYQLHLRTGAGLGYIEKTFDADINNKNIAIGSHLNAFINLRLSSYIRLYKPLVMEFGLGLSHFSNGGSKAPNKGINIPTINLSLIYELGRKNVIKRDTTPYTYPKHRVFCIAAGGVSQLTRIEERAYGVGTAQFFYDYHASPKSSFGGGIDLMYNTLNLGRIRHDSIPINSDLANLQVGGKVFYQFNIHRIMLPIEMGVYAFTKYKGHGYLYHRIGVRYLATKHLVLNLTLKTHFAVAEYIEWGAGWCF